jgi:hypothetical protein
VNNVRQQKQRLDVGLKDKHSSLGAALFVG